MMKMIFNNKTISRSVSLLIVFSVLIPFSLSAQRNSISPSTVQGVKNVETSRTTPVRANEARETRPSEPVRQDNTTINTRTNAQSFCSTFEQRFSSLEKRISNNEARVAKKHEEINSKIQTRLDERLSLVAQKRDERQERRQEHYIALMERAFTDEQKAAVAAFKASVEEAVVIRQAALDEAVEVFHSEIVTASQARQAAIDSAINTFRSAQEAAFLKVKNNCTDEVDRESLMREFKEDMKIAREEFMKSQEALNTKQEVLTQAREKRKESVDQAIENFKQAVQEAREELKQALNNQ